MNRITGTVCFALAALFARAEGAPWGWAYDKDGKSVELTERTSPTGGAVLTNGMLAAGYDRVLFAAGEVKVARIEVTDRDVTFVGQGTTLVQDQKSYLQYGGAISVTGGSVLVTNLVFSGFYAETAGGALALRGLTNDSAVVGCRFENCTSDNFYGQGGAIHASAKVGERVKLSVVDTTFENCLAGQGGAVSGARIDSAFEGTASLYVTNSTFSGNTAAYGAGGAIFTEGNATFDAGTVFDGNVSGTDGGAVCVDSADPNYAGAQVDCLPRVVFRNNHAIAAGEYGTGDEVYGGAVALMAPGIRFSAEKTAFLANSAMFGGAICAYDNDDVLIMTSIFSNNVVQADGLGGALDIEYSRLAMTNVTVRGSNSSAVDIFNAQAAIGNCVVINGNGADVSVSTFGAGAAANVTASLSAFGTVIQSGTSVAVDTNNCLTARTMADYDGDSLRLRSGEPYNPVAAEGLVQDATDFDGVNEYGSLDYGYSMGAYECGTVASVSSEPCSVTYDGKGHEITVSAGTVFSPVIWSYATNEIGPWSDVMPAFTNVGVYTVWAGAMSEVFKTAMVTSNTVTIAQREITLLSASAEKSYDTLPLTTNDVWVSEGELANGDFLSFNCTGEQTNVGTNDNTFTYSITNAFGKTVTDNYDVMSTNGTLIVTKRKFPGETRDLYLDATNFVYNAYGQGPKVTNDVITVDGVDFPIEWFDIVENVKTDVGGYTLVVRAKPEHAENFEGQIEVPWCITKAPLIVTAGADEVMYGAAAPKYKWTATGYQGADTPADIGGEAKYASSYKQPTDAGTYPKDITVTGLLSGNYEITYKPGDLVVRKRMVTLEAPTRWKVYDGKVLTFDASWINVGGEKFYADEKFAYSDFAKRSEVGTCPSTFTYSEDTAKLKNYAVTVVPGKTLTVKPSDDMVVATAASAKWAFDGKPHGTNGWTLVNEDLFLRNGDTFVGEINPDCTVTTPDDGIVSNLFKTAKIVHYTNATEYVDVTSAYKFLTLPGELEVTNATIRITNLDKLGYKGLYDGDKHTIGTPEVEVSGGVAFEIGYAETAEGPFVKDVKPEYVDAADDARTVWFVVTADYHTPLTNSATVKIDRRKLKFASPSETKIDEDGLKLTAAPAYVSGDGFAQAKGAAQAEGADFTDLATLTEVGSKPASFDIAFKDGAKECNYDVTKEFGTLTILKRGTIGVTAASETWTFDGTAHSTNGWTHVGELEGNDEFEVVFDPLPTVTYPEEGVVDNVISTVRVWRAGTDVTTNYTITTLPGKLKVTAFDGITATVEGVEKVYDGNAYSIKVTPGTLPYGGTAKVRYSTQAAGPFVDENPAYSNVCSETVWAIVEAKGYVTKTNSATVTITKRPVTIVSASGSWTYDGKEHGTNAFVSVTGFVGTDGVSKTNCTGRITDVGTSDNSFDYALTAGTHVENYAITTVNGTLSVMAGEMPPLDEETDPAAAALSWYAVTTNYDGTGHTFDTNALARAIAAQKLLSENKPVVTYEYNTNAAIWADSPYCFTNVSENAFWYRVTANNFKPFYHKVLVKVTPREVTLTSGSQTFTYDGAPHACSNVTVTSALDFVDGEGVTTNGFAQVTNVADSGKRNNTFGYEFLPNTSNINYVVTLAFGDLTVEPADLPPFDPKPPQEEPPFLPDVGPFPGPDLPEDTPLPPPFDPKDPASITNRLSNYDYVNVYDGRGHTLKVADLEATLAKQGIADPTIEYSATGVKGSWVSEPFVYTNVVGTSFWYRVSATNYNSAIHAVGVTITQRVVVVQFPTAKKAYDGNRSYGALTTNVVYGTHNMVKGEAFFGTAYGEFDKPDAGDRAFTLTNVTFAAQANTRFGNYKIYFGANGDVLFDDKGEEGPGPVTNDPDDDTWPEDPEDVTTPGEITPAGGIKVDDIGDDPDRIYRGTPWEPVPVVRDGAGDPVPADEYKVEYFDNTHRTNLAYVVVTMTNNYVGVFTNYFTINPRRVVLATGSKEFVFTGAAQSNAVVTVGGDGFVAGEGVVTNGFASITTLAESGAPNVFDFSLQDGMLAKDYEIETPWGTLTMVAAKPPPAEDDDKKPEEPPAYDPTNPLPPPAPVDEMGNIVTFSDFDVVTNYDGEAHTINTNALVAAVQDSVDRGEWLGETPTITYSLDGIHWQSEPFVFTNATTTSFWYKVSAPNFSDFVHAVAVVIAPRAITLRSASEQKYLPAGGGSVSVSNGFVWAELGEFVGTDYFAAAVTTSITSSTPYGPVDNRFDAEISPGLAGNYAITKVFGELQISTKPAGNTEIVQQVPDKTGRDIITIVMDNKKAGRWAADMPPELKDVALTVDKNPADKVEIRVKVSEYYSEDAFSAVTNEIVRNAREKEHKPEKEISSYEYEGVDITIQKKHDFYAKKGDLTPTNSVTTNIGNEIENLLTIVIPYEFSDKLADFSVWRHHSYEEGSETKTSIIQLGYGKAHADSVTGEYYTTNDVGVALCVKKLSVYVFKSLYQTTPQLTGAIRWKYHQAQNVLFAGLDVTCTNGEAASVRNLMFIFEDGDNNYLRSLTSSAKLSDTSWVYCGGKKFGAVSLGDVERQIRASAHGTTGVSERTKADSRYVVPLAERTIALTTRSPELLCDPEVAAKSLLGYLIWQEEGSAHTNWCAVGANAVAINALAGTGKIAQPLSLDAVRDAMTLGLIGTAAAKPLLAAAGDAALSEDRPDVEASVAYGKSRTLAAVVTDNESGDYVGTAKITVGKISRKGVVKLSAQVSLFAGKSYSAKQSLTIESDGSASGTLAFKAPVGTMAFELVYEAETGSFSFDAAGEDYSITASDDLAVGGKLDGVSEFAFAADIGELELPKDFALVGEALPDGEVIHVANGKKWTFDKSATVKYVKDKTSGEYVLSGLDGAGGKTNLSGLKLTYSDKTGVFSGSFRVYATNEGVVASGGKPTLKKYTAKVKGVVVNGEGYGVVTVKVGTQTYAGLCTIQ